MIQDFPIEHFFSNDISAQGLYAKDHVFTKEDLDDIGKAIFNRLRSININRKNLDYFENNLISITLDRDTFFFKVTNDFIKSMVEKYFLTEITSELNNIVGGSFQLKVIALEASENSLNQEVLDLIRQEGSELIKKGAGLYKSRSVKEAKFKLDLQPTLEDQKNQIEATYLNHIQAESNLTIDVTKTFDNFVIGHFNKMAQAVAIAIAKNPGTSGKYPSVYIHGPSGLGKTHLLHAVANSIQETYPAMLVCLISAREFMKEMINYMQKNMLEEFQKKYTERVDVLMIDDIHELKNKKGTQNEFFHVFNKLHQNGKQLIFTSDRPPQEIIGIEERIKTRLQWGLVTDIGLPDLEARLAILQRKSMELDLQLSDETSMFIASTIRNNIRELEGALIKIVAYLDIMKGHPSLEAVQNLLYPDNRPMAASSAIIRMEAITRIACKYFGVDFAETRSKSRHKSLANARHMAMLLTQKQTSATLHEIGNFFGNRDHSSVLYGIKKLEEELQNDSQLMDDFRELEYQVSNQK